MSQKKPVKRKESGFIDPYTLGFLISLIGVGTTYITTQQDEALQLSTEGNPAEQTAMIKPLQNTFGALTDNNKTTHKKPITRSITQQETN